MTPTREITEALTVYLKNKYKKFVFLTVYTAGSSDSGIAIYYRETRIGSILVVGGMEPWIWMKSPHHIKEIDYGCELNDGDVDTIKLIDEFINECLITPFKEDMIWGDEKEISDYTIR